MSTMHSSLLNLSCVSLSPPPQTHNRFFFTIIHTHMQKLWNPFSASWIGMDLGLTIWDWITHLCRD